MKTIKFEDIDRLFKKFNGSLSIQVNGSWDSLDAKNEAKLDELAELFYKKQLVEFTMDEDGMITDVKYDLYKNVDKKFVELAHKIGKKGPFS